MNYGMFRSYLDNENKERSRRRLPTIPEKQLSNFATASADTTSQAELAMALSSRTTSHERSAASRSSNNSAENKIRNRIEAKKPVYPDQAMPADMPLNFRLSPCCNGDAVPEGAKAEDAYTCCHSGERLRAATQAVAKRIAKSGIFLKNRFLQKRNSATFVVNKLNNVENAFYLGSASTILAKGDGCTDIAVRKIWKRSEQGRIGVPVTATINDASLRLQCQQAVIEDGKHQDASVEMNFSLRRISYCATISQFGTIVAWVYRHEAKYKRVVLRCHAICLKTTKRAMNLSENLNQRRASDLNIHKRHMLHALISRKVSLETSDAEPKSLLGKLSTIMEAIERQ